MNSKTVAIVATAVAFILVLCVVVPVSEESEAADYNINDSQSLKDNISTITNAIASQSATSATYNIKITSDIELDSLNLDFSGNRTEAKKYTINLDIGTKEDPKTLTLAGTETGSGITIANNGLDSITINIRYGNIIDNRTQLEQDLWTPEQYQMRRWPRHPETGELVTWEACQTFSGSWGYYRDEMTWKSPKMLVDMLINTVSLGGNLLMNVGPTARGYFDKRAQNALGAYAEWMKYNSDSIYGCTMAEPEFRAPIGTRLTQSEDGKHLYIHLQVYPFAFMEMPNLAGKIKYARFLHDHSEILYTEGGTDNWCTEGQNLTKDVVVFRLPHVKPDILTPVIDVLLK